MIDVLRPETNARSVIEPEPTSHWLTHRNLEPLTAPQTFDLFVAQVPSRIYQHGYDPTINVTPVLTGPFDHVLNQTLLIVSGLRNIAVRRAMLLQDPAGAAVGNTKPTLRISSIQLRRHAGLKSLPLRLHPE